MATVGTTVSSTEVPAASTNPYATANAFIVGLGDWGSSTQPIRVRSITDVQNAVGPRSATNSTLYDSCDAFFHEGGSTAYLARVVGASPTSATYVMHDGSAGTTATLTAAYPGAYGNQILVAVVNSGASVTITLTDTYGNTLASSPTLTTVNSGTSANSVVPWLNSTGIVTAVAGAGTLPATLTPTAMAGGANGTASLSNWTTALSMFGPALGPGQVLAPGATTTTLSGMWAALGSHALANNRVALYDMDDNQTVTTLAGEVSAFNSIAAGPGGFWAGNQTIPGIVPATTRNIFPSTIVAALCARADGMGNPNRPAAGASFPLQYVLGPTSLVSGNLETYNQNDLNSLNSSGINTFASKFGVLENYGFVSSLLSTTDSIYWQFNHARMRMALQADAQVLGEPFVFSQLDGQGTDLLAFNTALTARLMNYWQIGALYGATAQQAFSVNTGPTVNTPATLAAGQLNAAVNVRMSPFAQSVPIVLNAVPITQNVPVV